MLAPKSGYKGANPLGGEGKLEVAITGWELQKSVHNCV